MSEPQRESLEIDVVFAGGGPAGLAGSYHLAKLVERHNEVAASKLDVSIALLEKGKEIGSHILSGAVVDPAAFKELYEDWRSAPFEAPVGREQLLWMTPKRSVSMPIPPPLENDGKYVASLGKLAKWMAAKCEDAGVDIFCEFPAAEVLADEKSGRVTGVRTGDRGIGHDGKRKANFEPGVDIMTRALILAEGARGTLAKRLEKKHDLTAGKNPQVYAIGVKEVWELPPGRIEPGEIAHTMGWPLDSSTYGGGFVYGMKDDLLIAGLVVGLDYRNPRLDPHQEFQRFKTHPSMAALLEGGKMAYYGAKAIPEGGWFSMPRSWGDGFLITGDSLGVLNSMRLKGIHLAMKSGMLAAETVFEGLVADDLGVERLSRFEDKIAASWIKKELWEVRNFHQAFDRGMLAGMFQAGVGMLTNGAGFGLFNRLRSHPGHERMRPL
ncbi:MAG: NAD(P)/FAD-dependent oxidoreductase, partial [Deltaproteobacteria bacterium]|nr:NAD(P)/FAD-dependent oxidoreductase [Deltaproteobacteria bacterium]